MTRDDLLTLARELRPRVNGWTVDGRPITNLEMDALCELRKHERQERYEQTGVCCDAGPWITGQCPHGRGRCHLMTEARKLRRKAKTK